MPSVVLEAMVQSPIPGGVRAGGQRKGMLGANERHQHLPRSWPQIIAYTKQALLSTACQARLFLLVFHPHYSTKYGTSAWWERREAEPCQRARQPIPTCRFPCSGHAQGWFDVTQKQLAGLFSLHAMYFCTLINSNFKNVLKKKFESAHNAIFLLCCCALEQKWEVYSKKQQPEWSGLCCAHIRFTYYTVSSKRFSTC